MSSSPVEAISTLEYSRIDLSRAPRLVVPPSGLASEAPPVRGTGERGLREATRVVSCVARIQMMPPSDDAYWRAPAESAGPLRYLAWGTRQLGSAPIRESKHEGWVYTLIETGCPTLVREGRRERIAAPVLVLIGPDCAFGWSDDSGGASKLLVWMWRQPVHAGLVRVRRDAFARYALAAGADGELRQLHALSRGEIYRGDAHSEAALAGLQVLLETCIVRISEGRTADPREEIVERALHWIEAHLATRQPLARLADFLGVSPATVQRLFRKDLGATVMKTIAELRRREAERMLAHEGVTIKEVAYQLGYRHPHDFSRAFRRHSGSLPPRLGLVSVRE